MCNTGVSIVCVSAILRRCKYPNVSRYSYHTRDTDFLGTDLSAKQPWRQFFKCNHKNDKHRSDCNWECGYELTVDGWCLCRYVRATQFNDTADLAGMCVRVSDKPDNHHTNSLTQDVLEARAQPGGQIAARVATSPVTLIKWLCATEKWRGLWPKRDCRLRLLTRR